MFDWWYHPGCISLNLFYFIFIHFVIRTPYDIAILKTWPYNRLIQLYAETSVSQYLSAILINLWNLAWYVTTQNISPHYETSKSCTVLTEFKSWSTLYKVIQRQCSFHKVPSDSFHYHIMLIACIKVLFYRICDYTVITIKYITEVTMFFANYYPCTYSKHLRKLCQLQNKPSTCYKV